MKTDLNPYEPPPTQPTIALLWDRSVLTQLAFGIQTLAFVAYCLVFLRSEPPNPADPIVLDPRFTAVIAGCVTVSFIVVFVATITKTDWPLHLRFALIGIDALVVALMASFCGGFGVL